MVKEKTEKSKLDYKMQAWLMAVSMLAKRPVEMRTKQVAELFGVSPRKVQKFISVVGQDDPYLRIESPLRGRYIFTNLHNMLNPVSRHVDPVHYDDWKQWLPDCGGDLQAYIVAIYAFFDRAYGIKRSPYPKMFQEFKANGRYYDLADNANEILELDALKRTNGDAKGFRSLDFLDNLPKNRVNSFALDLRSFALSYPVQEWDANKHTRLSYYIKYIYIFNIDIFILLLLLREDIDIKSIEESTVRSVPVDLEDRKDYDSLEAMKLAVVDVCRSNIMLIADDQIEGAQKLVAAGITPQQVRAYYGKDRTPNYWYTSHWKGRKHQWPSIQDILTTIIQAQDYVPHFTDSWPGVMVIQGDFYKTMQKCGFDAKKAKKAFKELGYDAILEKIAGGYYHLATVNENIANILIANAVRQIKEEVSKER